MRPRKNIEKTIKKFDIDINPEKDQQIFDKLKKVHAKSQQSKHGISKVDIGRIIMKSKMTKFATAAVIVAVAILSITFLGNSVTPAYGITDALSLYKKARTVHIRGWVFYKSDNQSTQEYVKLPLEFWFDLETGCYNMRKPGGLDEDGKGRYYTTVSDGEYLMSDSYVYPLDGESYRSIRFEKITEFYSRFQARNSAYNFLMQTFGGADRVKGFAIVGDETIHGVNYGIWEGKILTPGPNGSMEAKIKSWMSLDTGKLGRIQIWFKKAGAENWIPVCDIDQIELNIELPENIFVTEPPEDCHLANTKETAQFAELGTTNSVGTDGLSLFVHAAFSLPDGSVILCWRSTEKKGLLQEEFFDKLKFGGDNARLPLEIYSLKSMPDSGVEYLGYHLAYTKKKDKFYEWSIYVPGNDAPPRDGIIGYEVVYRYNTKKKQRPEVITMTVSGDIQIDTADEFGMWVLGAMKELSDNGEAPNISYDSIQKLTSDIRDMTY